MQPGVHVAIEQCRLVFAHALEIGIRDLQLVRQLATRQPGDTVVHRVAAFLDDEAGVPQIVGGMAHQRRRHDQVLLRMQLAFQFLSQADERTSVFHSNLLLGKFRK
ncbi:hypothetical protein, partial [Candidatus Skiveiella danica]|uniref:hypothetical protein n=1 Tax=Candidatus Skiveiella danica TaxID=3386177 RepID=UPI0039B86B82